MHIVDVTENAPPTVVAYRRDVERFVDFAGRHGLDGPAQVGRTHVRSWIAQQRTRGLAPATVARRLAAVRRYAGWLVRRGVIDTDPTAGLRAPAVASRLPRVLRQSELDELLDAPAARVDDDPPHRRLREKSQLPVIFLTSKDDEIDEALGLAMGADDYIAKPFSQRLVIARIRAILRRVELNRATPSEDDEPVAEPITRGRLQMDPARHKVSWDGKDVTLTVTEFLILETLASRPGIVRSRNQLMDAAYQDDVYIDDRTIDSHIKRLRRKFREVDPDFNAIDTLYGAGYRFSEE